MSVPDKILPLDRPIQDPFSPLSFSRPPEDDIDTRVQRVKKNLPQEDLGSPLIFSASSPPSSSIASSSSSSSFDFESDGLFSFDPNLSLDPRDIHPEQSFSLSPPHEVQEGSNVSAQRPGKRKRQEKEPATISLDEYISSLKEMEGEVYALDLEIEKLQKQRQKIACEHNLRFSQFQEEARREGQMIPPRHILTPDDQILIHTQLVFNNCLLALRQKSTRSLLFP